MSYMRQKINLVGFSFLEFLIVVAIIGILTAIAIPAYGEYVTRTKSNKILRDIEKLQAAISDYRVINEKFVSVDQPEKFKEIYGIDNPAIDSKVIDKVEVTSKGVNNVKINILSTGSSLSMKPGQSLELILDGEWSKEDGTIWQCSAKGQVKYAPAKCRDKDSKTVSNKKAKADTKTKSQSKAESKTEEAPTKP